jgi:DNA repair exonuclease SbcCD ATPase subunit
MRLRRIGLKDFKRFLDFQAQFSPGINVVKGPLNETGKSTLLEGIIVALFHNPKSTAKELEGYSSWGLSRRFRTSLEFEEKGNRYLLEKDFEKGTIRLICDNTREDLDTFKEISTRVTELLGTKSDTLFSCSSCIRQSEVSEISSGKKQISESLEEVVMGGKESTFAWQVVQKLDSKVADIRRGLDKLAGNPGVLANLRNKTQGTSQRYSDVKEEVSKVEAKKVELVEVSKQLAEVKERYENVKGLLDKNEKRRKIEASIGGLEQKYDEVRELLDRINELTAKLERADEELSSFDGFETERQVSELRKKLDAIQNRREDIEKDLAGRERELAEAKEKLNTNRFVRFSGSGSGIATALIILIAGIIGASVVSLYFLALAILGVTLLVIAIRARTTLVRHETSISDIKRRLRKMREAVDELSREESEFLAEVRCNTVGEFEKKESDVKTSLRKKRDLEAQLKGMLRGKTFEDFQKQEREVARNLAVEKEKLTDDLQATELNPERHFELEREFQSLEQKKARLERQEMECEATIKQARFNIEDQIRLEEELEGLQEALKHEDRKVRIYALASKFLSRARVEVLSSVQEALEKEIQRYLTIFTDNKYKQVRVDKEALEFWVYSDEKGDWAKPEELSGGAIDEFYMAFRLALARLIFGDKKPPLILDDPFVNFDSVRLDKTLGFFKTLALDYQIIIFTLGNSYDKVADNIILLREQRGQPVAQQQIEGGD